VLEKQQPSGRGLRLVHKFVASTRGDNKRCQYDESIEFSKDRGVLADASLQEFLEADGLMRLLIFLSENELPKNEVIEIIKRLHIPGYEQARLFFKEAIRDGVFEPDSPAGFHWQSEINAVLKHIASPKRG
jgi:hypothetical protein